MEDKNVSKAATNKKNNAGSQRIEPLMEIMTSKWYFLMWGGFPLQALGRVTDIIIQLGAQTLAWETHNTSWIVHWIITTGFQEPFISALFSSSCAKLQEKVSSLKKFIFYFANCLCSGGGFWLRGAEKGGKFIQIIFSGFMYCGEKNGADIKYYLHE